MQCRQEALQTLVVVALLVVAVIAVSPGSVRDLVVVALLVVAVIAVSPGSVTDLVVVALLVVAVIAVSPGSVTDFSSSSVTSSSSDCSVARKRYRL